MSLQWLADLCGIASMQGGYSSGGSVANLLALGAARQSAFEGVGRDPAATGVDRPVGIYATSEAHHTVQRSAGVLGLGRQVVRLVACDNRGRMRVDDLRLAITRDRQAGVLPMAIVANAGTTNTGSIDPLQAIGELWALIREIGVDGMAERIRRHNDMASHIARVAREHPHLEPLQEPNLSICCFRHVSPDVADLDRLNERLHRRLVRENRNMPSTTRFNGRLALRPCFVGARTHTENAQSLLDDVLRIGAELASAMAEQERQSAAC